MSYQDVRSFYEEPPDDPLPWEEVIRNAARDAARELISPDGAYRQAPESLVDAIAEALPGIYDAWAKAEGEAEDRQREHDAESSP